MRPPCESCRQYLASAYFVLRGACASVGIEHGMSTDDTLGHFMARRHQRECVEA